MSSPRSLLAAAAVATLCAPAAAQAGGTCSLMDHVGQVISTFMGDPAAGVDCDMKHVLDKWRAMHPKPLETLSPEDARRQPTPIDAAAELAKADKVRLKPSDLTTSDVSFAASDGETIKARIYTPVNAGHDPRPVVVFYHGGGFVLDNDGGTDASARAIATGAGAIVVAPGYRLAPEHKFPAAQEDALAAYRWVLGQAGTFGGDPERVALAGEGAGALLAADVAVAAPQAKLPQAAALVLITPAAGINLKTNSWTEDKAARPWNDKAVAWALGLYLPKPDDKNDPRIDLVGKADVSSLPPTTIVTAEIDPLRSDGERLGGKLKRGTVPVFMRDYPGVTHDFFGMGAVVAKAAEAQSFVAERLKAAFAPKSSATAALEDLGIAPYPVSADPATSPVSATTPNIPGTQPMDSKKN